MSTAKSSDWTSVHGSTPAERNAYILKSGLHSDVTLIVGEKKERVKAHKLILMTASPVFEQIFSENPGQNELEITCLQPKELDQLLKFIYTGVWVEDSESASSFSLLYASFFYELSDLAKECVRILMRDLTAEKENAVKFMLFFFQKAVLDNHEDEESKKNFKNFICKYAYIIFESEGFLDLTEEWLLKLLKSDQLAVKNESQVFEALIRWADAECERQGSPKTSKYHAAYLDKLIPHVRFPQMEKSEFVMKVAFRGILTQEQVTSAFIYYEIPPNRRCEVRGLFNSAPRNYFVPEQTTSGN